MRLISFNASRSITLTELLSVCVCLLVVGSMLLEAIVSARDKSLQCGCSSNLRQTGQIFSQYTQDYHSFLPSFAAGKGLGDLENWKDLYAFSDPENYYFSSASIPPTNLRQGNMTLDPRVPRLFMAYSHNIDLLCCNSQGPTALWKDIGPYYYNTTNPFINPSKIKWEAVAAKHPVKPLAGCQNPEFVVSCGDRGWRHGRKKNTTQGSGNFLYAGGSVTSYRQPLTWPDKGSPQIQP